MHRLEDEYKENLLTILDVKVLQHGQWHLKDLFMHKEYRFTLRNYQTPAEIGTVESCD